MTQYSALGAIPNASARDVRLAINEAIAALATQSSGSAPPANPLPGQIWDEVIAGALVRTWQRDQGNAAWQVVRCYAAAADPIASDDASDGYVVGSEVIVAATGAVWRCIDATTAAAVWQPVTRPMATIAEVMAGTVTAARDWSPALIKAAAEEHGTGEGAGGTPAGNDYDLQFRVGSGFSAPATAGDLSWSASGRSLQAASVAVRRASLLSLVAPATLSIAYAGNALVPIEIAGTGGTATDLTVEIPTGSVPDWALQRCLLIKNTHATALLRVVFSTAAGQHLLRCREQIATAFIRPGDERLFVETRKAGGPEWVLEPWSRAFTIAVGGGGTPAANAEMWQTYVHTGLCLCPDVADVGSSGCDVAPSANTDFLVQVKSGVSDTWSSVVTIRYGAGQRYGVPLSLTAPVIIPHGSFLRVVAPPALNGIINPLITLRALDL